MPVASGECELCARVRALSAGGDPYLVGELATGYAVLAENQYYRGCAEFILRECIGELHELTPGHRQRFLNDMAIVGEAVFRAFSPRRMNYELLGNSVPHLHWRFFPRHRDDPMPRFPVWENTAFIRSLSTGQARPDPGQREEDRGRLSIELEALRDSA